MIYQNKKDLVDALIKDTDEVLDVGFWGQGVSVKDDNWVHKLLYNKTKNIFAFDLDFGDEGLILPRDHYFKANAESFEISKKFDVIFAGDLIEHLSNPGLFLERAREHLKDDGKVIISTPSAFNLFNITEKLTKREPTVNPDHTCYFNSKTLSALCRRFGFKVDSIDYIYSLGVKHKESYKKRFLNILYWMLSKCTDKFIETFVIVLTKDEK